MSAAEALVDGVRGLPERFPPEIDRLARLHLLDAIGVGLAAARGGPARGLVDLTRSSGPCTVLGALGGTSPSEAALVNGTLIHSLEFDDTHTGSVMHGSSVLAPAVLAAAEASGADGASTVRAFAIGWEVLVRLGLAAPSGFQRVGFQGTSVAGPIAGALAVGVLEGFDRTQLLDVVGVAASFSAGNFTFLSHGATSKAAQAGIGAQAALSAVALVRGGITGSPSVFEGERGFYDLYAQDASAADRLVKEAADLGSVWHLERAAFKGVPCCHFLHPFVEAVVSLDLAPGGHTDLARIVCRVPVGQEQIVAEPWASKQAPTRADEARWSLPYVVALQAVRGRVELDDFTGAPDAEVLAMATRVEGEPWPDSGYPAVFPAEIAVEWRDGTRRTVRIADVDGGAARPWTTDRVVAKFSTNAGRAGIPDRQAWAFADSLTTGSLDLSTLPGLAG